MCSKANEDILKGAVMKFVVANEMPLETCLRSAYDGHFWVQILGENFLLSKI